MLTFIDVYIRFLVSGDFKLKVVRQFIIYSSPSQRVRMISPSWIMLNKEVILIIKMLLKTIKILTDYKL